DLGIKLVGVVDQVKITHAGSIKLPVSDCLAVGTPAPSVAQIKFFFVDPVESAVDGRARAVRSQRGDLGIGESLDIQVVLAYVAGARSVRREFGEHQGRGLRVAAKLGELAVTQVEHPKVTTCV